MPAIETPSNNVELREEALKYAIEVLKTEPGGWSKEGGAWISHELVDLAEGIRKYILEGSA